MGSLSGQRFCPNCPNHQFGELYSFSEIEIQRSYKSVSLKITFEQRGRYTGRHTRKIRNHFGYDYVIYDVIDIIT